MKPSEQQISAAQSTSDTRDNQITRLLESLGKERCELHQDEIITHLCCKQKCSKVKLCIKCLINDREHYLAHNPVKNFKSIEELIEIAEKALAPRDVAALEKKLLSLLEVVPTVASKLIADQIGSGIVKLFEPDFEEFVSKSLEQENYLWLQDAAKCLKQEDSEQIAQKLMKNTDSDNFLFTEIEVAAIEKTGIEI